MIDAYIKGNKMSFLAPWLPYRRTLGGSDDLNSELPFGWYQTEGTGPKNGAIMNGGSWWQIILILGIDSNTTFQIAFGGNNGNLGIFARYISPRHNKYNEWEKVI